MENKNNCFICGHDLLYRTDSVSMTCHFCKEEFVSNTSCTQNHFICDACHAAGAKDIITKYCLASTSTDALEMANELMKHPAVKMHGPEHHFLVPAVLITAWSILNDEKQLLLTRLTEAQKRSNNVLGGFCGFYGCCGAAVGTGIFMSIITETTPTSSSTWGKTNLITSDALRSIALKGGPRCCKRDTFIAIKESIDFVATHLQVKLPMSQISCSFAHLNKECIGNKCDFFQVKNKK